MSVFTSERVQRPTPSLQHLHRVLLFHSCSLFWIHDALKSAVFNNSYLRVFFSFLFSWLLFFFCRLSSIKLQQEATWKIHKLMMEQQQTSRNISRRSKHGLLFCAKSFFFFFPLLFWCKLIINSMSQCALDYIHSSNCSRANKSSSA